MISIAPMIDISNHHFRSLIRIITKKAIVYTQMKSADAIIHNHKKLLPFHSSQHPIVLQIGGSNPQKLAEAAKIGQQYGFDEINLNIGCPSPKVKSANFGVVLMKQPNLVRQCLGRMQKQIKIPCSVKCRLGVDNHDSYQFLSNFISIVSGSSTDNPVKKFIIHARKALLKGLNPKQNRTIPALDYSKVFRIKEQFPNLTIEINGGIKNIEQGNQIVKQNNLDGFMVGRLAFQNPFQLRHIDSITQKNDHMSDNSLKRLKIMLEYVEYLQKLKRGEIKDEAGNIIKEDSMFTLINPILNLYHGQKFACYYRRNLSDLAKLKDHNLGQLLINLANFMEKADTQEVFKI